IGRHKAALRAAGGFAASRTASPRGGGPCLCRPIAANGGTRRKIPVFTEIKIGLFKSTDFQADYVRGDLSAKKNRIFTAGYN
ncbi:MAG: hypothetical protein RRZ73_05550, partial [Oscillospiraceae bacterium]